MKHFLNIILVLNLIQSCSAQSALNYNELDLKWKKDVMFQLSGRFVDYIKVRPRDSEHNYELDMYNKFIDINRYPFGTGIAKLKHEVESEKIVFDSIICLTKQSSLSFNPEYLYPNYYYMFKNGELIKVLIFKVESLNLSESDKTHSNLEKMFETAHSKTDGNDSSLLIFTKINPNWKIEISKIVINSYSY